MGTTTFAGPLKQASGWAMVWGILMVIFGLLAICLPLASSIGVAMVVAWLIVFSGVAHLVFAFHSHTVGGFLWKLLLAVLYLMVGVYILMRPLLGVASLTLALAVLFLVEGVLEIILYFQIRPFRHSGWVLLDGIVTLFLGSLIWRQWPSASLWVIGTLVGISLIFSGTSRFMLALAARRLVARPA